MKGRRGATMMDKAKKGQRMKAYGTAEAASPDGTAISTNNIHPPRSDNLYFQSTGRC